jgi:dTDP-4-amino-4,6-dideoxygalactose transaminase
MTCFSFHPVKTVTAAEGGAILTNSDEFYDKLVLAHTHGITHDEDQMEDAPHEGIWYYEQISLGFNYRMTDFQAALLISQMNRIDDFVAKRKEIVKRYNEAFADVPGIIVQKEIPESDTSRHLYIIRLDLDKLSCTRREFFDAMSRENVQCQVHYVPVYWFPYYRHLGYEKGLCPNAEEVYKGIMSIPLYPRMSDKDIEDTIHAVKKLAEYYRK